MISSLCRRHILVKVEGSCGKSSLYHIILAKDLDMTKVRDGVKSCKYKELVSMSAEAIVDRFKNCDSVILD